MPRYPHEAVAAPAAAVLGTLLHAGEPGIDDAFPALAAAIQGLNVEKSILYYDVVMAGLPDEARKRWEAFMQSTPHGQTFRSELFRRIEAKSKAEGEARSVLAVLDARGLTVPEPERERILATTDTDLLETWLRRAVTADSVEEALAC